MRRVSQALGPARSRMLVDLRGWRMIVESTLSVNRIENRKWQVSWQESVNFDNLNAGRKLDDK